MLRTSTRRRLRDLLVEGRADGLYTGAALAIGSGTGPVFTTTVGTHGGGDETPVSTDSRFDAASVTKAVVTTTVALRLVEHGKLALGDSIGDHLPDVDEARAGIELRHLLTHTSGLAAYHYDANWTSPAAARAAILDADVIEAEPGERFTYSCLNFVHLAAVLRTAGDASLATLADRHVFGPIGMHDSRLGPIRDVPEPIVATYDHDHEDRPLVGEIHDPIARALDGEAGNAGLFTTVTDLARFGSALLESRSLVAPSTHAAMRRDWLEGFDRAHGLGWRRFLESSPAGNWSRASFGHTGFTGTSIWIDPAADRFVVLLTNEVFPGKGNGFPRLRERIHGVAGRFDGAHPNS